MNDGTIAAIFVTILGCFLILAAVFLFYKWRRARLIPMTPVSPATPETSETQRYRLRRGRMVPMSDKNSIISSRSGWTSLRPLSHMFGAKSFPKNDKISVTNLSIRETSAQHRSPEITASNDPALEHRVQDPEAQTNVPSAPPRLRSPSLDLIHGQSKKMTQNRSSAQSGLRLQKWPETTIHENAVLDAYSPNTSPPKHSDPALDPQRRPTFLDPPSRASFRAPSPVHHFPVALEILEDTSYNESLRHNPSTRQSPTQGN